MNAMMPPFVNPYQAIIQRVYSQKMDQIQRAKAISAAAAAENEEKNDDNESAAVSTPATTTSVIGPDGLALYVGNLCKDISDEFFSKLLNGCGNVVKWKRMKDTFGFVNFETAA